MLALDRHCCQQASQQTVFMPFVTTVGALASPPSKDCKGLAQQHTILLSCTRHQRKQSGLAKKKNKERTQEATCIRPTWAPGHAAGLLWPCVRLYAHKYLLVHVHASCILHVTVPICHINALQACCSTATSASTQTAYVPVLNTTTSYAWNSCMRC